MDGRVFYLAIVVFVGACVHSSAPSRVTQVSGNVVDEVVGRGPLRHRVAHDDVDLVLYVAGEQRGVIGPCACEAVPKGAMAQLVSYRDAAEKGSVVRGLLVNPGAYFQRDGVGTSTLVNTVMLDGLLYASWDALNVTAEDLPFLRTKPDNQLPLVSANLRAASGVAVSRVIQKRVGEHDILITGVSEALEGGVLFTDPITALEEVVQQTQDHTFVIVLAHGLRQQIPALMAIAGVDVVIDADGHVGHWPARTRDGVLWVTSRASAVTMGEVRFQLSHGDWTHARLRTISMDEEIPGDKTLMALAQSLQGTLDAVRER